MIKALSLFLMMIGMVILTTFGFIYFHRDNPDTPIPVTNLQPHVCSETPKFYPPIKPVEFTWNRGGLVTFWFDDATETQFTNAFPLLEKAGYTATVAVPTNAVCKKRFMTWNQLRYLQSKGWEISSHTKSHICDLAKYDQDTTTIEFKQSKEILESQGLHVEQFVMPCGYYRPFLFSMAMNYYKSYRSSRAGLNSLPVEKTSDLHTYTVTSATTGEEVEKWVESAKRHNAWLIIVFHQLDAKHETYSAPPALLSNIISIVKKSGLQVVLPSQALEAGQFSAKKNDPIVKKSDLQVVLPPVWEARQNLLRKNNPSQGEQNVRSSQN